MTEQPYNGDGNGSDDGGSSAIVGDYIYRLKGGDTNGDAYSSLFYRYQMPSTTATATATGPTGSTNNPSVTLTYTYTGSPTSVKIYYTNNTSSPYTWTPAVEDTTVNGSEAYTITSGDGTYGWNAVAIGGGSTETDPPSTSTAPEASWLVLDTSTPDIVAVDAGASSSDRTFLTSGTLFNYAATGSDDQISFSWTDSNSPSDDDFYYELNTSSGNTITWDESTVTTAYKDGVTISEGTSYFHVRPKNGVGTWGTERTFTIKYDKTAPAAPSLVSPSDGTITSDNTPTFDWTSVSDPSGVAYVLQYSTDPSLPPAWFDSAWSYRAPITITEQSGGNLVGYQVRVDVTYSPNMQPDFDDLRFTDNDGKTLLNYWVENYTAAQAVVWVKVPSIPAGAEKTIYVYYGNPSAGPASNGSTTFINFAGNQISGSFSTDMQNSNGFIIEAGVTVTALQSEGPQFMFDQTGNGQEVTNVDYLKLSGSGSKFRRWDTTSAGGVINMQTLLYTYPLDTKKSWKIAVKGSSYWFYFGGGLILSGSNLPYTHGIIQFGGWSTGDSGIFDWVGIRKYASSEPTTSVGEEAPISGLKIIGGLSENSYTMPDENALADNTYYWRVLAVDGAGNVGDWSDSRMLTIDTTAPPAPSLVSPENGENILDNTPTFKWTSVSDPSGVVYNIQVDNDPDFSSPEVNVAGLTDNTYTSSALADENYSWRVRAKDNVGNIGNWSETWQFTVDTIPPAAFDLSSPTHNSWVTIKRPTLSWGASSDSGSGLKQYRVFVDDAEKVTTSGTSWQVDYDLGEGSHSCYVKAEDQAGNFTQSTSTFTVKVDTVAPETARFLSGSVGSSNWWISDVTVTLSATDPLPGSGVSYTKYRVDGGSWLTYSSAFTVSGDGTYNVDYYSVDVAGNDESMKSVEVKIVAIMLVWREGSVLKYKIWNGENWGPAENIAILGGRVNWTVLKYARTRNEAILGALDATGSIRVWIWDGNNRTWSAPKLLASVGTTIAKYRPFDIEYETGQDRAMVVFLPSSTATKPKYMIWNGTSWSDNTTIGNIPTGVAYWIELAPNSFDSSNEMAMITLNSAKGVSGMVWKGSAWDNMGATAVWHTAPIATKKCIDVAYEQKSGRAMFAWADTTATQQYYRIWNGSTLTGKTLLKIPAMGGTGNWVRLVPDPNSNKLMYGVQDAKANLNTRQWSGSAWDNSSQHPEHDAAVEDILDRNFDMTYETFPQDNVGHAWLVWGDGGNVSRRHWDGSSWDNITKAGDDTACVQLATHPASGMVFALVYEDSTSATKDFYEMRLTSGGGTWTKYLIWGGPTPANPVMEPFMIACRRKGAYVHV
jgi:hypothetical protein